MARYRRKRPTGKDHLAASATSLLIGAGAALASYYVARLLLSREELPQSTRDRTTAGDRALRQGGGSKAAKALRPSDERAERPDGGPRTSRS